jgi:hypothetical protein
MKLWKSSAESLPTTIWIHALLRWMMSMLNSYHHQELINLSKFTNLAVFLMARILKGRFFDAALWIMWRIW